MNQYDFGLWEIVFFSTKEIEDTGAKLSSVKPQTIKTLDVVRGIINMPIVLLPGGLTTGDHKSQWHPAGMAVDFALKAVPNVPTVVYAMLQAGFKGVGVYYNGIAYSFHGDLRPQYALWGAWKRPGAKSWNYEQLIIDPRGYLS